jgi:plasmid stabilization system protein ParE
VSRSFRLTRRAEESLVDIARWTIETFGQNQADLYEAELIARCEAMAKGQVSSRDCSILVPGAESLRFTRAGEHFLVYLERPNEMIVVDILHSRSDLPRHVTALAILVGEENDDP